jgi:transposase-like protein
VTRYDVHRRNTDTSASTDATVVCPYCGEESIVALDPGSGARQRYVEDCPVCCRPWVVDVRYDDGLATVRLSAEQDR